MGSVSLSAACQSRVLWGYACPFEGALEIDHLFPYGLGGPTRRENAMVLCAQHNRMKAHDIHVLPWEAIGLWQWIDGQVERMAHQL